MCSRWQRRAILKNRQILFCYRIRAISPGHFVLGFSIFGYWFTVKKLCSCKAKTEVNCAYLTSSAMYEYEGHFTQNRCIRTSQLSKQFWSVITFLVWATFHRNARPGHHSPAPSLTSLYALWCPTHSTSHAKTSQEIGCCRSGQKT